MATSLQAAASGRIGEPSCSGRSLRPSWAPAAPQQQPRSRRQRQRQQQPVRAAVTAETAATPPSVPVLPRGGRGPASDASAPLSPLDKVLFPDIQLPLYDADQPHTFDVVVVGSGPAGLAVADRVAQAGFQVCPRLPRRPSFLLKTAAGTPPHAGGSQFYCAAAPPSALGAVPPRLPLSADLLRGASLLAPLRTLPHPLLLPTLPRRCW